MIRITQADGQKIQGTSEKLSIGQQSCSGEYKEGQGGSGKQDTGQGGPYKPF